MIYTKRILLVPSFIFVSALLVSCERETSVEHQAPELSASEKAATGASASVSVDMVAPPVSERVIAPAAKPVASVKKSPSHKRNWYCLQALSNLSLVIGRMLFPANLSPWSKCAFGLSPQKGVVCHILPMSKVEVLQPIWIGRRLMPMHVGCLKEKNALIGYQQKWNGCRPPRAVASIRRHNAPRPSLLCGSGQVIAGVRGRRLLSMWRLMTASGVRVEC